MRIIKDISIDFSKTDLAQSIQGFEAKTKITKEIDWVYQKISELVQPKAIVDLFDLQTYGRMTILRSVDGSDKQAELFVGPRSSLLRDAEIAQVSIITLGKKLDEFRKDLHESSQHLRAFILDTAGILSLTHVGKSMNHLAEVEAEKRGWGVGHRMVPGSLIGWDIQDQQVLCQLLPMQEIGVRFSSTNMLMPLKSVVGLIGIGRGYSSSRVKSTCKWCHHKSTCVWAGK